jgi:hypothetical protein
MSLMDFSNPQTWLCWLLLLVCAFMCAVTAYAMIRGAWEWLVKKATAVKAGKTNILLVIAEALLFLIATWFFGSAGMRFISQ